MKRIFAITLACAMTLSLLSSCGKKDDQPAVSGSGSGSISSSQSETPDVSQPEDPDASKPENPDASQPEAPDASKPEEKPEQKQLKLNKTDFSLFKAGATFQLKAAGADGAKITWTSSNEAVATVDEKGVVTYVAPGKAVITAAADELTASAVVYCKEDKTKPEQKPEQKPDQKPAPKPDKPANKSVDLSAFSTTIQSSYEFGFISVLDKELTDQLYPGLTAISTNQRVVNGCMMSNNMGEFVLVEVKNSKDVDAVKGILNARIKTMVDGGAYYPAATEMWSQNSKVVSNGNYVMMVVHEENAAIAKEFNALFK